MKKSIIYISSILSFLIVFLWSCEEAPLNRDFTPESGITKIKVEVIDKQDGNPDDDSGLDPVVSTLVGNPVIFSSNRKGVTKRTWRFPNSITANDGLTIKTDVQVTRSVFIEELGSVSVTFTEGNNANDNRESNGFVVILEEVFEDGRIEFTTTQVRVRSLVTAGVLVGKSTSPAAEGRIENITLSDPLIIKAAKIDDLGISSLDTGGKGQIFVAWDFGAGYYESDGERLNTFTGDGNTLGNSFNIMYDNTTTSGNENVIKLTVTRNFPLKSSDEYILKVRVSENLLFTDSITLNPLGNEISVIYPEAITGTDDISTTDYSLDYSFISGVTKKEITINVPISSIDASSSSEGEVKLILDDKISIAKAQKVTLKFTSDKLRSVAKNTPVSTFEGDEVLKPQNFVKSEFVYFIEDENIGAPAKLSFSTPNGMQVRDPNSALIISDDDLDEFSPSTRAIKFDQVANVEHNTFYFVSIRELQPGNYQMSYSAKASIPLVLNFWNAPVTKTVSSESLTNEWTTYTSDDQTVGTDGIFGASIQFPASQSVGSAYVMYLNDFKIVKLD